MFYLLAQRISFSCGMGSDPEAAAKSLMVKTYGPKFAERVLSTPELRKKIGLDRPMPDPSSTTTVVVTE